MSVFEKLIKAFMERKPLILTSSEYEELQAMLDERIKADPNNQELIYLKNLGIKIIKQSHN